MNQYSVRAQSRRRKMPIKPKLKNLVKDRDDGICQYCGEMADTIDHVIPYSYGGRDELDNLVAACRPCNFFVSDMVFDTIEAKRAYIQGKMETARYQRLKRLHRNIARCADCQEPFLPRVDGATAILCGPCALIDESGEYGELLGSKGIKEDAHDYSVVG